MLKQLWADIEAVLNQRHPQWRQGIIEMGQIEAIQQRKQGKVWTDTDVLKGNILLWVI